MLKIRRSRRTTRFLDDDELNSLLNASYVHSPKLDKLLGNSFERLHYSKHALCTLIERSSVTNFALYFTVWSHRIVVVHGAPSTRSIFGSLAIFTYSPQRIYWIG